MNKNRTISDLNVEIQRKGNTFKRHLVAKVGICIIEFLLASVFYCYGIILSEYVLNGNHKYGEGIWTTVLFICSWSFTDPIARFISEYFEDKKNIFFRYFVGCNTALLFIGIMVPNHLALYMIFGGVFSNFISTQVHVFATEKLDMDSKVFEGYRQVSRALSLFVAPHCVFALLSNYETNQVKLIFASILLNIVPAALIVKTDENWKGKLPSEMSRYQTIGVVFTPTVLLWIYVPSTLSLIAKYLQKLSGDITQVHQNYQIIGLFQQNIPLVNLDVCGFIFCTLFVYTCFKLAITFSRFAHQMNEMKNFGKEEKEENNSESESSLSEEEPIFELHPHFLPTQNDIKTTVVNIPESSNNQYSGIENYGSLDMDMQHVNEQTNGINPINVQTYYHKVGVSILPGIPEESEDEADDINIINSKRLSRISDKLEILKIQDQIRRDSIKEIFSINEIKNESIRPESIDKIEYIPNFQEEKNRISVLDELKNLNKTKHCFQCSPYRKFTWTRRLRSLKDFVNDNFFRPLFHALKNLYFYPALTTKVTTNLVSTLYITLAPFMAMQKSWKQHLIFSTENATFLLTYIAFAWCFFLVVLPLVLRLSHEKVKMVFGFGLVVSGASLWLLSGKLTNDVITISSLLFGFGYGIITYTEKIVYKSSIGMRPWYLVRGPLEVLSATCILIIYYVIYLNRLDLKLLLMIAALSYFLNAFLWFCLPFVKYCGSIARRIVFDERSQQEGFFH